MSQRTPSGMVGVGAALARNIPRRLEVKESDTPGIEIQALMDSCARVKPSERPDMDTVLRSFKAGWPVDVEVTTRTIKSVLRPKLHARFAASNLLSGLREDARHIFTSLFAPVANACYPFLALQM